jgi:hypothetical protein
VYASKLKKISFTFWNLILNVLLHKRPELANLKLINQEKFQKQPFFEPINFHAKRHTHLTKTFMKAFAFGHGTVH